MNPTTNPFSPGAGTKPPELVGRESVLEKAEVMIQRSLKGRDARGMLLIGLRGVGKTVLINQIQRMADAAGAQTAIVESPEQRSLPAQLTPVLRSLLLKLSHKENAKALAQRGLKALGGFLKSVKVKFQDVELGVSLDSEVGLADSGDFEADLSELIQAIGEAARAGQTAVLLLIDELQYVAEDQLSALIVALHRCHQRQLPVLMVAAGLPQLVGQMGRAKSYAERMFEYPSIGALSEVDAASAIREPAAREGVEYTEAALAEIYRQTQGYPYFLQEWGKHTWNVAKASPVTLIDVEKASPLALADLDASFFRVRLDRLTPSEKRYITAMACLGPGPYRSGEIAARLNKEINQTAPVRASLIKKGMIYSPSHGDTHFTVPLFDAYVARTLPPLGEQAL
jgi:hypothetical protein